MAEKPCKGMLALKCVDDDSCAATFSTAKYSIIHFQYFRQPFSMIEKKHTKCNLLSENFVLAINHVSKTTQPRIVKKQQPCTNNTTWCVLVTC